MDDVRVRGSGVSLWDDSDVFGEDEWDAEPSPRTVAAPLAAAPARYTYGWLQGWLYNECLPELRAMLVKRGFISLHQLARAALYRPASRTLSHARRGTRP